MKLKSIKINKENIIKYSIFGVFIVLTLFIMLNRTPFWDEANSWMVSKSFNLFELIQIEKYDGHLFIWHLLQMPFSKNDFYYPYSIYFLNWIFCLIALIIFWNKAPFSILEKSLITLSFPFVRYFSTVARCYSIGLIFLFLILSFYPERLKRPYLISTLIILLANTSAMALIGAFSLGIIFIYDIIKEKVDKKVLIYSSLILLTGALLAGFQLFGAEYKLYEYGKDNFILRTLGFFFLFEAGNSDIFALIFSKAFSFIVFAILFCTIFYLKNSKNALLFIIISNCLLLYLFIFKYPGDWWHYLFFFIFLISAIWLKRIEDNKPSKFEKPFNILFLILISFLFIETFVCKIDKYPYVFSGRGEEIAKIIKTNNLFKDNDKVIALDAFSDTSIGINPYFKNLKMYDIFGSQRYTPKGYKNNLYYHKTKINYENIYKIAGDNSRTIAITSHYPGLDFDDTGRVKFIKLFENKDPGFIIYEVKKIKD